MKPKRVARDVQEAMVLLKAFLDSPQGSPDTLAISLRTDVAEELIAEIGELGNWRWLRKRRTTSQPRTRRPAERAQNRA